MSQTMRVGIVGCGGIARAHLRAYREAGAQVVSVYDTVPAAAEKFAPEAGATVAVSLAEMAAARLDAVSVCSPPGVHYENCKPFLKARVPILCEKPMAADARAAARLAAAVRQSGTLFMVAYCHRFHPAIVELRKLIQNDVLGTPVLMRNVFGGFVDISANHRANKALGGGGVMIDNGSHSSDLFRFLVGEPTAVTAMIGNAMQRVPVEDFCMLDLEAAGPAFGQILSSYSLKVCGNWIEWYGTKGTAIVSYWNAGQPDLSYRLAGAKDAVVVDCSQLPQRFPAQIAHFLACVRSGSTPAITAEDGLKASRIIAAAYKSAATGRRVRLRE